MSERIRTWLVKGKTYKEYEISQEDLAKLYAFSMSAAIQGKQVELQLDGEVYDDMWINVGEHVPDDFENPFNS